jgi:hypothetical protein
LRDNQLVIQLYFPLWQPETFANVQYWNNLAVHIDNAENDIGCLRQARYLNNTNNSYDGRKEQGIFLIVKIKADEPVQSIHLFLLLHFLLITIYL